MYALDGGIGHFTVLSVRVILLTRLPTRPMRPNPSNSNRSRVRQVFRQTRRQLTRRDRRNRRGKLTHRGNRRVTLLIGIQSTRNRVRRQYKHRKRSNRRRRTNHIRVTSPLLNLFRLFKTENRLPRGTLSRPPPRWGRRHTTYNRARPTMSRTGGSTINHSVRNRSNSRKRQQGGKFRRHRRSESRQPRPFGTLWRYLPRFRHARLIGPISRRHFRHTHAVPFIST